MLKRAVAVFLIACLIVLPAYAELLPLKPTPLQPSTTAPPVTEPLVQQPPLEPSVNATEPTKISPVVVQPSSPSIEPNKTEPSASQGSSAVTAENENAPRLIVQPEVRKIIDENKGSTTTPSASGQEEFRKRIEDVVKQASIKIALEIDTSCSAWSVPGATVLNTVKTDKHVYLLLQAPSGAIASLANDPCVLRLSDEAGFKAFLNSLNAELEADAQKKAAELDLKDKRGLDLSSSQLEAQVSSQAPVSELPAIDPVYNVTSSERISYQAFVTPSDASVQSIKASSREAAYSVAVSWVWISDSDLNGASELWFTPGDFLTKTPKMSTNPTGRVADDCEEHANTLVSLLRAQGVSAYDVKVVLGKVDFSGSVSGHAWVELKQSDGTWMALESTSGPMYADGRLHESLGLPFDYWKYHQYPLVERWVEYNDVFFVDYTTGRTNAPSSWSTQKVSDAGSALGIAVMPVAELQSKFTTPLFCTYRGHLWYAEQTRISMEAALSYVKSVNVDTARLSGLKDSFVSGMSGLSSIAESNDQAAYDAALASAAGTVQQFHDELASKSLDTALLKNAIAASLSSQQGYLDTVQAVRLKYCKSVSVAKFEQYVSTLRSDAARFEASGCGPQNLDEVVQTVSTYDAYLENYMDTGSSAGVGEIQKQMGDLREQLTSMAGVCRHNLLAQQYNQMWDAVSALSAEGVDMSGVSDELNGVAALMNAGDVDGAEAQLKRVKDEVAGRAQGAVKA